ncbi:chromosomal replication initiator protein DnaA [Bacillus freudenreichii]|nr:chromosomal replication initiator protein DnaA [Bacillus freudenreichii]
MENLSDLWEKVLENIEKKISKPSFDTWLKSTEAYELQGDTMTVAVPNDLLETGLKAVIQN